MDHSRTVMAYNDLFLRSRSEAEWGPPEDTPAEERRAMDGQQLFANLTSEKPCFGFLGASRRREIALNV